MLDFLTCRLDRYRSFGIPNQFPVKNRDEIINNIQRYNNQKDVFLSICEYDAFGNIFPLWFFIDLDSIDRNQDLVNEDASKILNWIEKNDLTFMMDESGHKGLHFLLELNPDYRYYNNQFRAFYFFLLNNLDLKTIDSTCCETKRLCRVPETINMKSGKLCCTLIEQEGKSLNIFDYIDNDDDEFDKCDYEVKNYSYSRGESKLVFPFDVMFAPCIFDEVRNVEVEHYIRWRFVKLLQFQGYSVKEIFDECKSCGWGDFSPSLTESQIQFTLPRSYTLKCNKQICLNDSCPLRKHAKKEKNKKEYNYK